MSNTWKRFLSLLLAIVMILSLGVTGFADEVGEEGEPAETPEENEALAPEENAEEPEPDSGNVEMEEISPDKLKVPKLGLEESSGKEIGEPVFMKDDLNQVVRVSIFLDRPSTLAAGYSTAGVGTNAGAISYRNELRAQQNAMTALIEGVTGHPLHVHWNMTLAVNAISADVTVGDILKIEAIPGVRSVQRENRYLPMDDVSADPNTANTSENMVGAADAWAAGYTGAGSRIAIIDTGIDTTHQSFAEEPFLYSVGQAGATGELMTQEYVQGLAGQLNSGSGNYVSAKIPYGFNYVDGNTVIDHMGDKNGEHGSHVAGIAAANRYIGSGHADAASTVGAVGMAPDAQLLVMKVFGANGGAYDSDYMVAIEDAIVLGADVANLSLGSSVQGWTFDNEYQDLVLGWANGKHNGKMVLSISAGNSYDLARRLPTGNLYIEDVSMHTGGSPGTFLNSLCVASANNTLVKGTPMTFNGNQDVYYYESTGEEEEEPYSNPALSTIVGSYTYVYIDATGTEDDFRAVNSAVSLSGKVVIVNRGGPNFTQKGETAKSYDPKAVIVANNQSGVIYMKLPGFTGTFPMVTITQRDAESIKKGGSANTVNGISYYTGSVQVTNTQKEVLIDRSEATVSDFSSWGVPGSLIMKPEITAPGGNIYSVNGSHIGEANNPGGSDQYENMSGTSMAAPHIAGLTAVLAEYQRENNLPALNSGLAGFSTRAIAQSLMMSTATPMAPGGNYLPILQQGAGLVDVSKALTANSVIMMDPANSGLTGKTGAAMDGKVKVELGDDPDRTGDYSFGFTVYNLTDDDLHFTVDTDVFTQAVKGEYMSRGTANLGASATCWWAPVENEAPLAGHDVDMDGDTDADDARAILDYLTGEKKENEVDLDVADLDGDKAITTLDAYLLLGYVSAEGEGYSNGVVPAHGSRYCSVRITLPEDVKTHLDEKYPGGAYIEGFTFVTCDTTTEDDAVYEDAHSIPILGFYGSWTDATMFDTVSYTEALYGSEQESYTGNDPTNYMTVQMNGANVKFSGNPYKAEESFPADRLAINSSTKVLNISYNLVRAAGTTGFAVTALDEDGKVTEVLGSDVLPDDATGIYYSIKDGWQGMDIRSYNVNKAPSAYELTEGDHFRIGFYAIPEYNAMVVNNDYSSKDAGTLDKNGFETLLMSNVLGKGAFVGYDFVVDNTEPEIESANLNGSELTVTASDNMALAYVAIVSLNGETVYADAIPGKNQCTITLDASDAIENASGYVAVFAGDYAGNEAAMALKVNDKTCEERTVYVLTDTLTAGEEYLIVNRRTAGEGSALMRNGTSTTAGNTSVTVNAGTELTDNKKYIEGLPVADTAVWTAGEGSASGTFTFVNGTDSSGQPYRLCRQGEDKLYISTDGNNDWNWTWDGANNRLSNNGYNLQCSSGKWSIVNSNRSVYLYQKTVIRSQVDPEGITEVSVTPETLDLYKGNTADLTAKVLPLTVTDRTVTWSSNNPAVATVDAFGHVTAVGRGSTTIRATANGDNSKYAECKVIVVSTEKNLNAFVWDENGKVFYSNFNSSDLPTWNKLHDEGLGTYPTSAFVVDESTEEEAISTLYAGTLDSGDATTELYTFDSSNYALTWYSNNYLPAFGMARASNSLPNYFVYGYTKYLVFGNLNPEEDEVKDESGSNVGTGEYYTGYPYGLLKLANTSVGDAYVAGVCAKTFDGNKSSFYFLDETGKIWETTLTLQNKDASFSNPTLVVDTGISTSFLYQSIYYDGTYLYWSHKTNTVTELIVISPSTRNVYHAGNFGEGVWPVAGLHVRETLAPASVGDAPAMTLDLEPVANYAELMTEDVIERITDEFALFGSYVVIRQPELTEEPPAEEPSAETQPTEEPAPAEEPVEEAIEEPAPAEGEGTDAYTGSLMAFRGNSAAAILPTVDPETASADMHVEDEPKQISLDVYEEDSHNGRISLVYDPASVSYQSLEINAQISAVSVHVDEETGIITIAYANKGGGSEAEDYIDSASPIVTVRFTADCEDSEGEITTLERNDELNIKEDKGLIIPGTGHDWAEPTWEWAEDYSAATASFVCRNNPEHTEELTATATSEQKDGTITYTAKVELEDKTYTDTREVQNAHDHVDANGDLFCDTCHERMGVTVTATSAGGTLDGPTVAFVKGGGKLYYGQATTLEAVNVAGYIFDGWYRDDEKVSDQLTYTYTAPEGATEDANFVALYVINGDSSFSLTITGSKFTISSMSAVQRTYFKDTYTGNSDVTVNFVGTSDETFLYWINASGKIVSTSPSYSFTMIANTELHAVTSDADTSADEALVVFLNSASNGQVLSFHYYTGDETIVFPIAPSRVGRVFTGWSMTEAEIKGAMANASRVVVYPTYAFTGETRVITLVNNINSEEQEISATYGDRFTLQADETLGSFSYWMIGGKIVSYSPTLMFRVTQELTVTAVYGQSVEPTAVMTMTDLVPITEDGAFKLAFYSMRSIPEGYTVEESGIIISNNAALQTMTLEELQQNFVLDSYGSKRYTAKQTGLFGEYYATMTLSKAMHMYGRAYAAIRLDGKLYYVYSDEILDYDYQP